jgi:hypothetical protein
VGRERWVEDKEKSAVRGTRAKDEKKRRERNLRGEGEKWVERGDRNVRTLGWGRRVKKVWKMGRERWVAGEKGEKYL